MPFGNWPSRAATKGILEAVKQEMSEVPNTEQATITGIRRANVGYICRANVVATAGASNKPDLIFQIL